MSKKSRTYVYVKNCKGEPVMPCSPAKARRLLRDGQAEVVDFEPFTIQLKYGSSGYKQSVTLGVDTGSVHVGLCASTKFAVLLFLELRLRTDIVKLLSNRRMLRRSRRSRKTRYRAVRFNNRVKSKKDGWLAPSIRYKLNKHLSIIEYVSSILPIAEYRVEVVSFDIQRIKNPDICGAEYQCGAQLGFWNAREYVLSRDGHVCRHCGGKSGDKVLNVHHIESRKTGGDSPNNLVTLCETCHRKYHAGEIVLNIKRGVSFRWVASVVSFKDALVDELKEKYGFDKVHVTYGYITKFKRIGKGLPKEHYMDAFCIADNLDAELIDWVYKCRAFRRHNRSLHVMAFRRGHKRRSNVAKYWLGKGQKFTRYDKVVCNGVGCFITGSSHGYGCVRDIDGNKAGGVETTISTTKLKKLYHARHGMMVDKRFFLYRIGKSEGN